MAEDHVGISIFLASKASRYLNGRVIPLDCHDPEDKTE